MVDEHIFGSISIMFRVVYWSIRHTAFKVSQKSGWYIKFTVASHLTQCGAGVKFHQLTLSFLHQLGYIYHIPHNNHSHYLLEIISNKANISFDITTFTTIGCVQYHCSILCTVSDWFGKAASGPDLKPNNVSVRFETCLKT